VQDAKAQKERIARSKENADKKIEIDAGNSGSGGGPKQGTASVPQGEEVRPLFTSAQRW
jgi:hypothetical protein